MATGRVEWTIDRRVQSAAESEAVDTLTDAIERADAECLLAVEAAAADVVKLFEGSDMPYAERLLACVGNYRERRQAAKRRHDIAWADAWIAYWRVVRNEAQP